MAITTLAGDQIGTDVITDTHIANGALALAKLAEAVIQADGGQAFTADQSLGGFKITGLGAPSTGTDAANQTYVDTAIATDKKTWTSKLACNLLLDTTDVALGDVPHTIDSGDGSASGTRILVTGQDTNPELNGIYTSDGPDTGSSGAGYMSLTRATDFDEDAEVTQNVFTSIGAGGTYANTGWLLSTDGTITVGTTGLVFTQIWGPGAMSGSATITVTGNTISVTAASIGTTQLTNLGVTTAKLAADAVDGTKLADNAVDSEHITAGSIDNAHLADNAVDTEELAANAVTTAKITDNSVDKDKINADVAGTNISQNADGSLELERLAAGYSHIGAGTGAAQVSVKNTRQYALGSDFTSDDLNLATFGNTNTVYDTDEMIAVRNSAIMYQNAARDYTMTNSTIELTFTPAAGDKFDFYYRTSD